MGALRTRSLALTSYLEALLTRDPELSKAVSVITPSDPAQRGAQLSLRFGQPVKAIYSVLQREGVIVDIREVRAARARLQAACCEKSGCSLRQRRSAPVVPRVRSLCSPTLSLCYSHAAARDARGARAALQQRGGRGRVRARAQGGDRRGGGVRRREWRTAIARPGPIDQPGAIARHGQGER